MAAAAAARWQRQQLCGSVALVVAAEWQKAQWRRGRQLQHGGGRGGSCSAAAAASLVAGMAAWGQQDIDGSGSAAALAVAGAAACGR